MTDVKESPTSLASVSGLQYVPELTKDVMHGARTHDSSGDTAERTEDASKDASQPPTHIVSMEPPQRKPESPPEKDPNIVTWDEHDQHENPRNWNHKFKLVTTVVVSLYTLLSPITSSMVAPALDKLEQDFHVHSKTIGNLMLSAQMLAFVLAPLVYGPMSERIGRKYILNGSNLVFLLFNVGCGLARTSTQMIVLRFFLGLAGCAPMAIGSGTIADLFEPEERGQAMAMYTLSPVLGPCVGPIFAGWIIQGYGPDKWRWIFWVSTMFGALVAVVGALVLRETYVPVLLERKAKRLRKETGNMELHTIYVRNETLWTKLLHLLTRPGIFLATQPVVQMTCLYQALLYGCQYLLLTEFTRAFQAAYHQPIGIATLHYIAYLIGFLITGQIGGRMVDVIYRRLREKHGGVGKPEYKLPLLVVTGVLMPFGLLLYGWPLQYHVHWIVPDIGIVLIAAGIRGALFICPLYLADSVTLYTASATSAAVMLRGLFAFCFPLFSPPLYRTLGQGWGNSLLALITALIGVPTPFLLYNYGAYLRSKSKYSQRGMSLMT